MKGQDILLALKIAVCSSEWTFRSLSAELGMSISEISKSLQRAEDCNLIDIQHRRARESNLAEFLCHGIRYCFPAKRGPLVIGIPTSFGAAPLNELFKLRIEATIPVWKDPYGTVEGYEIEPLYPSAPMAAQLDNNLYQLLALSDAIREGQARERKIAQEFIRKKLSGRYD